MTKIVNGGISLKKEFRKSKTSSDLQQLENFYKATIKEIKTDYRTDLDIYGYQKGEDVFEYLQGLEFNDYENLAWFAGYTRGLEEAINLLKK